MIIVENDSRIVIYDQISHKEAVKLVANADILVNFGNNIKEMTPSKIFEYMSYGKPIISTMPISDEPSAVYLRKYPISYLLEYNAIDYEREAIKLEEYINENIGKRIDFKLVKKIFYKNMPSHFCDVVIKESEEFEDS